MWDEIINIQVCIINLIHKRKLAYRPYINTLSCDYVTILTFFKIMSLTSHMTQCEQSDWRRFCNSINTMIEYTFDTILEKQSFNNDIISFVFVCDKNIFIPFFNCESFKSPPSNHVYTAWMLFGHILTRVCPCCCLFFQACNIQRCIFTGDPVSCNDREDILLFPLSIHPYLD